MSRFGAFDVDGFVSRNENQATLKKTLGHINLVREFLREKGENRELWFIPQEQLDPLLASFFINVRTKDGSNYEPSSLRGENRSSYFFALSSSSQLDLHFVRKMGLHCTENKYQILVLSRNVPETGTCPCT